MYENYLNIYCKGYLMRMDSMFRLNIVFTASVYCEGTVQPLP